MKVPGNLLGRTGSAAMAAVAAFALTLAAFIPSFNAARLGAVLVAVLALHVVRFARVVIARETLIYSAFLAYMLLELLWTDDRQLALNTLVPAMNFVVILVLFTSLAVLHDVEAVLAGAVAGFIAGAAYYSIFSGFPFRYPAEFSYNAIASMYLFGLLVTLLLSSLARWKAMLFALAGIIGVHIVATTSIKTNVGILLGILVVGAIHFGHVARLLGRNALVVLVAGVVLAFSVATNESFVQSIQRGANRVALGIEILQAREDLPGYSSFERRESWQREGFRGWTDNPLFGHGVEAFRSKHGITSHASHVDIAYNSGLIGLALFYGLFASLFLRLYQARHGGLRNTRLIILGGVSCGLFITFASTIHYGAFLAAFLALSVGILKRV